MGDAGIGESGADAATAGIIGKSSDATAGVCDASYGIAGCGNIRGGGGACSGIGRGAQALEGVVGVIELDDKVIV